MTKCRNKNHLTEHPHCSRKNQMDCNNTHTVTHIQYNAKGSKHNEKLIKKKKPKETNKKFCSGSVMDYIICQLIVCDQYLFSPGLRESTSERHDLVHVQVCVFNELLVNKWQLLCFCHRGNTLPCVLMRMLMLTLGSWEM